LLIPVSPVGLEFEVVEVRGAGRWLLPAKREWRCEPGQEPEEEPGEGEQAMLLHDRFMGDQVCVRKCSADGGLVGVTIGILERPAASAPHLCESCAS